MANSIHRPLIAAAQDALVSIFKDGRQADKTIEFCFKRERRWGARDRRFFAQVVYDCTRWMRRLAWTLGQNDWGKNPGVIADFTREDGFNLIRVYLVVQGEENLPDWLMPSAAESALWRSKWLDEAMPDAVKHSLPDWLEQKCKTEIGKDWAKIADRLNETAPAFLRSNPLRRTRDQVQSELKSEGIETSLVEELPHALRLVERRNVFVSKCFQAGGFEMQDAGSQKIAPMLDPQPGERVIDACAGAGGKSLHIAALMRNQGRLIAMDVHQGKLEELKRRSRRAGCDIIEVREISSSKVIKRLEDGADRVLLDVPCSGSGVWRRNPDARWRINQGELTRLRELQSDILKRYSRMVRPGGTLVYATCSLWPSENEKQVQEFLSRCEGRFELVEEIHTNPLFADCDGFYAARLDRKK